MASATLQKKSLEPLEYLLLKRLSVALAESPGDPVLFLLLVSGGHDSMALARALGRVCRSRFLSKKPQVHLETLHFNHRMRTEAAQDADFVMAECLTLGLPVHVVNKTTDLSQHNEESGKGNFQAWARAWRQREALALAKRRAEALGCSKFICVTAHHARDHVETVLLNILRGAGAEGLRGLRHFDPTHTWWKPWHDVPYAQLQDYVNSQNILFRHDATNDQTHYRRNALRHNVLPQLEALVPSYEKRFLSLSTCLEPLVLPEERDAPHEGLNRLIITQETTINYLYKNIKKAYPLLQQRITRGFLEEILNLAKHMRLTSNSNAGEPLEKRIFLKEGYCVTMSPHGQKVFLQVESCPIMPTDC